MGHGEDLGFLLAQWGPQVSFEQRGKEGGVGSNWIWIFLGVAFQGCSCFDAAHLRGFRIPFSDSSPYWGEVL